MSTSGGEGGAVVRIVRPRRRVTVLVLEGEHDLSNSYEFEQVATLALARDDKLLVVDLSETLFIDSTLLAALIQTMRAAQERGTDFRLRLGDNTKVRRILEISGLLSLIPVSKPVASRATGSP